VASDGVGENVSVTIELNE
jgi:hypothetical protein